VLVNPSDRMVDVELPAGHWSDVDGNSAGPKITLRQQTGVVLLGR